MGLEVRPLGVKCNIQCQYCYQNPQKDAGNVLHRYDLGNIKQTISRLDQPFTLFGGEILLVPIEDLEDLWAFGLEKYDKNSIQTNGTLITDTHIELFKRYKVDVGISLDGPDELNDVRWAGSLKNTRQSTARTLDAIRRLCENNIPPSLILTLHRANATGERLPRLAQWLKEMEAIGVRSARLHVLETDAASVQEKYALTSAENQQAFLYFAHIEKQLTTLKLDVFEDIRRMLSGRDNSVTCIWAGCDPYTTLAVQGIEGDGQSSNCGRTNKDGIDFTKADEEGFERYLALYHTPQSAGGCKGCRFFLMCKGNCPGTSLDGDWRNRTQDCSLWFRLLEHIEAQIEEEGIIPISKHPQRIAMEERFVGGWAAGIMTSIALQMEELDP